MKALSRKRYRKTIRQANRLGFFTAKQIGKRGKKTIIESPYYPITILGNFLGNFPGGQID